MSQVRQSQNRTQSSLDTRKMIGHEITGLIAETTLWQRFLTDDMSQVAGIDTHRTRHGTKTISCTSLVTRITILLFQQRQTLRIITALTQTSHFTLQDDTLTRRQGEATRKTIHFTETALDASVHLRCRTVRAKWNQRQWFEVLDVTLRIVIEDDTRIQQAFRVKQILDRLHGFVGIIAPFVTNVRSHVSTGTMFCLQRTIVLVDYQSLHIFHQVFVTFYFGIGTERLIDDEMVIAFQRMAIDTSIIVTVTGNELLEFFCCFRKVFDMECYVFNQASSSRLSGSTH